MRRLNKRLNQDGVFVSCEFLLYLNNESPMRFESRENLADYLKKYRADNEIFKLQIYKIKTYSL